MSLENQKKKLSFYEQIKIFFSYISNPSYPTINPNSTPSYFLHPYISFSLCAMSILIYFYIFHFSSKITTKSTGTFLSDNKYVRWIFYIFLFLNIMNIISFISENPYTIKKPDESIVKDVSIENFYTPTFEKKFPFSTLKQIPIEKKSYWIQKIILLFLLGYFWLLGKSISLPKYSSFSKNGNYNKNKNEKNINIEEKHLTYFQSLFNLDSNKYQGLPIFGFQYFYNPSENTLGTLEEQHKEIPIPNSNNFLNVQPLQTKISWVYKISYFILGSFATLFAGEILPGGIQALIFSLGIFLLGLNWIKESFPIFKTILEYVFTFFRTFLYPHAFPYYESNLEKNKIKEEIVPPIEIWKKIIYYGKEVWKELYLDYPYRWFLRLLQTICYFGFDLPYIEQMNINVENDETMNNEFIYFIKQFVKSKFILWIFTNLVFYGILFSNIFTFSYSYLMSIGIGFVGFIIGWIFFLKNLNFKKDF